MGNEVLIHFWKDVIKKHVMLYPNERIAQFMGRKFSNSDNSNKKALDIGFGSGRHLKIALDYGFDTYGIDYYKECKIVAEKTFNDTNSLKNLYVGDYNDYDFGDIKFDLIIFCGTIFLTTEDKVCSGLNKLYNITNKDGKMIITFRSKDDYLYKQGKQVSKNSYLLDKEPYKNAMYTFYNKEEIEQLLDDTGFKIDYIEREDYWKDNLSSHNSWYIVSAVKK